MLQKIIEETNPFDKADLLSKIAALQLLPANADHAVRLEAIAHAIVSQKYASRQPKIGLKRLKEICNSDAIKNGPIGQSEDPSEQMFTEAFTFEGGSYVVFPGIVDDATHILRNLTKAIFLSRESPFTQEFIQQSRILTTAILRLSDIVAHRAEMNRRVDPVSSREVVVPSDKELQRLRNAVVIDTRGFAGDHIAGQSFLEALEPFIAELGSIESDRYTVSSGPLHLRPLIRVGDGIIVSEPGVLLATLRHNLVKLAIEHALSKELARHYRLAVWDNVVEMLDYLQIRHLESYAPSDDEPYLEGVFVLDRDKALYVQLITDDLTGYPCDNVFGFWSAQKHLASLNKSSANNEAALFSGQSAPNEVMDLVLLQSLGRVTTMAFDKRGLTNDKPWLSMSASELETVASIEAGDPLVLLKYARSQSKVRSKAKVFSVEQLNEFQLYRRYHYSYYISDEKLPNALLIPPGFAGEIRREVSHKRDRHGAPAYEYGYVVEVTCRFGEDVPIYIPMHKIGDRAANLVEIVPLYVWVIGPDYGKRDERKLHYKYVGFADMITYWLWQCAPLVTKVLSPLPQEGMPVIIELQLSPYDKWIDAARELPKTPGQDSSVSIRANIQNRERRIVLILSPEILHTLAGSDNSGERHVMKAVFDSLYKLTHETTSETGFGTELTGIDRTMENLMPVSSKKMMIVSASQMLPPLDPTGIPHFRAVMLHDEQNVLDAIGQHLSHRGWKSGPIQDNDRVTFINSEVVDFLYTSLATVIATLKFDELLDWLVSYSEATIERLLETRLTIPTRLACFYENRSFVETLKKELPGINETSLATRFLIEYSIARPSKGIRPMSLEIYDQIIALSSAIITWGLDSDYLEYNIADIKLSILPSGRIGHVRDEFVRAQTSFLQEYVAEEIARATRAFSRYVTKTGTSLTNDDIEGLKQDTSIREFDEASLAEFGFTFTELGYLIRDIFDVGEEQPGPVKKSPLTNLIDRLSSSLGWSRERVSKALGLLTLSPRPDFLMPPPPCSRSDVYPWRFNRALSYIRRPLLEVEDESGEILIWGNRHLYHSYSYLFDSIISSRILAQHEKMKELLGKFNRERGETFNDEVADSFETLPPLIVRRRVKKLGKKYIRGKQGDLGDVDVLVIDGNSHKAFVIECKDLAVARTPYELKGELDEIFRGTSGEKSTIEKHQLRTKWVRDNLTSILGELDIALNGNWEVEPLLIVDEAIYSSHIYQSPIKVISYRQLTEEILPTWDNTKEWHFT